MHFSRRPLVLPGLAANTKIPLAALAACEGCGEAGRGLHHGAWRANHPCLAVLPLSTHHHRTAFHFIHFIPLIQHLQRVFICSSISRMAALQCRVPTRYLVLLLLVVQVGAGTPAPRGCRHQNKKNEERKKEEGERKKEREKRKRNRKIRHSQRKNKTKKYSAHLAS